MCCRATPNVTTGYNPYFLLNGEEMTFPSNADLNAKDASTNSSHDQRIANLKASLELAYESVRLANRKSHDTNKRYYDRQAKQRQFQAEDYAYVYKPARKPGLSRKFNKCWACPYKITAMISYLNYEILGQKDRN